MGGRIICAHGWDDSCPRCPSTLREGRLSPDEREELQACGHPIEDMHESDECAACPESRPTLASSFELGWDTGSAAGFHRGMVVGAAIVAWAEAIRARASIPDPKEECFFCGHVYRVHDDEAGCFANGPTGLPCSCDVFVTGTPPYEPGGDEP